MLEGQVSSLCQARSHFSAGRKGRCVDKSLHVGYRGSRPGGPAAGRTLLIVRSFLAGAGPGLGLAVVLGLPCKLMCLT